MAAGLRQYWSLTKPRVVALIVFTAVIGMFLAVPGLPPLGIGARLPRHLAGGLERGGDQPAAGRAHRREDGAHLVAADRGRPGQPAPGAGVRAGAGGGCRCCCCCCG
jgi:hypothetical protein